jgi:hypothetical protein
MIGIALVAGAGSAPALAVNAVERESIVGSLAGARNDRMIAVPLKSWPVDAKSFIGAFDKGNTGNLKAASDRATVYRPIPVCRLVDTRGFPAAVTIVGPRAPNSTTNVNAAGACGIPNSGVAGLSISFHVRNATVNNGGFIAFLQQGAPIAGVNAVFNFGTIWTATTANISLPDDSGNFEIYVAQSTIDVIVDVNGYYQDLDNVDVGDQNLGIVGNTPGTTFEVTNVGSGTALSAINFAGPALKITGSFAVSGAGIDSGTAAFILEVDTTPFGSGGNVCGGHPSIAVVSNPMLDNDPSAMVLVTPREGAPSSLATPAPSGSAGPVAAVFLGSGSCAPTDAANHWAIRDKSGAALVNLSQYSVLVIKSH